MFQLQIGRTSGLLISLSGISKSIILVTASVLIWGTQITLMQGLGYAIALSGLVIHSVGRNELSKQWRVAKEWAPDTWRIRTSNRGKPTLPTCRSIVIGLLGLMIVAMCGSIWYFRTPTGGKATGKLQSSKDDILLSLDLS
jgi:hypothetical protein